MLHYVKGEKLLMESTKKDELYGAVQNKLQLRKDLRGCKMNSKSMKMKDKKSYKIICIFPEKDTDNDTVKNDVKSILRMELRNQMERQNL